MKEKKDILFLCQYFYPEYISSATLPYDTAIALVNAGFSVSVLCGYPKEYNESEDAPLKEVHNRINIRRLNYIQLKRCSFWGRIINYFSFTIAVLLNFLSLKRYKSIIVYSNPPVLPFVAALANVIYKTKIIFVCYDVYPEIAFITNSISSNSLIGKAMQLLNKFIFKHVSNVVALSNEMKEYLLNNRKKIFSGQIIVIPNWYENGIVNDLKQSQLDNIFADLIPGKNLIVSYLGNLGVCQDLDTILNAIRITNNINDIKFLFSGHGNKMDQLKEIVKKEKLDNVKIYNFLHGKDFQDALNISDIFIVSLAEGLTGLAVPSKTYSYMMAGKPILAIMDNYSDISKDLIDNDAGCHIKTGEADRLVSYIIMLKNDEQLRKTMGINANKIFIEKYTKEICTLKYVRMMMKILEANPNV